MCDRNVTAAPSTFERVSKIDNINIIYDYIVKRINKNNNKYLLSCFEENNEKLYTKYGPLVDGVFIAIGMIPNTEPLQSLPDIKITPMGVVATENGDTGLKGFYVAGDIRMKNVRQGLTAAADGANAVNSVINYLKTCK